MLNDILRGARPGRRHLRTAKVVSDEARALRLTRLSFQTSSNIAHFQVGTGVSVARRLIEISTSERSRPGFRIGVAKANLD